MQTQNHYHYAYYRSTFTNFKGYESEISDSTICITEIFLMINTKKILDLILIGTMISTPYFHFIVQMQLEIKLS